VSWDQEHGCWSAGTIGRAEHVGDPLTVEQIKGLAEGTRIVVTWSGGNGPWERIVTYEPDDWRPLASSERTLDRTPLLWESDQINPVHRVTLAGGSEKEKG
jgi:hypothetical protein